MSRTRLLLGISFAASTALVVSSRPVAQIRSLTVAAMSEQFDQLLEWDQRVNQMARTGELRLRKQREDGLIPGRTHERFDQVFHGVAVWGGDITRQSDLGLTISIFGTLYADLAVDVEPKLSAREARKIVSGLAGGVDLGDHLPDLLILPIDGGGYALTYRSQAVTPEDALYAAAGQVTGAPPSNALSESRPSTA